MSDKNSTSHAEVIEEVELIEEEDEYELAKVKNLRKLEELIKELKKIERGRDPNIRICPRCFSVRVKIEDILNKMGISSGYPVCVCMDCGWRSKNWIYLDLTMTDEERDNFVNKLIEEKSEK